MNRIAPVSKLSGGLPIDATLKTLIQLSSQFDVVSEQSTIAARL